MAKYLLLYSGGRMPETEAEQATVMKAWDSWFHEIGSALADGGNPFTQSSKRSRVTARSAKARSQRAATPSWKPIRSTPPWVSRRDALSCRAAPRSLVYETFEVM